MGNLERAGDSLGLERIGPGHRHAAPRDPRCDSPSAARRAHHRPVHLRAAVPMLKGRRSRPCCRLGILKYCDGLAIHPYREPRGPEATFFFEELGQLRRFVGGARHSPGDVDHRDRLVEFRVSVVAEVENERTRSGGLSGSQRGGGRCRSRSVCSIGTICAKRTMFPILTRGTLAWCGPGSAGPSPATWPTPCVRTIWPRPGSFAG